MGILDELTMDDATEEGGTPVDGSAV